MSVALYIRKTESGPSIELQRAECWLSIFPRGMRIDREFVDEESFTGRPGVDYTKMVAALRSRSIKTLVAYSAERMFRGVSGVVEIMEHARAGGVQLFLCREGFSTDGVPGSQWVHAAKMLAEIDLSRRSEMTRHALMKRRAAGLPVGRPMSGDSELNRIVNQMLDDGVPTSAVARKLNVSRQFVRKRAQRRQQEGIIG